MTRAESRGQTEQVDPGSRTPTRCRLAVITSDCGGAADEDTATRDLIDSLVAHACYTDITVLLTERPRTNALVEAWRSSAVEVRVGVLDPSAPSGEVGVG